VLRSIERSLDLEQARVRDLRPAVPWQSRRADLRGNICGSLEPAAHSMRRNMLRASVTHAARVTHALLLKRPHHCRRVDHAIEFRGTDIARS